jgi:alkylation response protein AidB-like acyl-CoA dehydrogenase
MGAASTEPNAGSDNRYPPEDDPKSGWRLRAERDGEDWLLNGEKTFIANGSVCPLTQEGQTTWRTAICGGGDRR